MCLGNVVQRVDFAEKKLEIRDILLSDTDYVSSSYIGVEDVKMINGLTVLHLNVRSLHKKIDMLKEFIQVLETKNVTIDVLLLSETWLNENNDSLTHIEGYQFFHLNRKMTNGGGLAIYVSNNIKAAYMSELSRMEEGIFESLFLRLTCNKKEFVVGELYRVPNSPADKFNVFVSETLTKLRGQTVILGSDQNLDLLKMETHTQTNKFLEIILSNGLVPTILRPTRVTHQSATLIDNIYVSADIVSLGESHVIMDNMSDHFPCILQTSFCTKGKQNVKEILSRKLNDTRVRQLNHDLLHTNWLNLLTPENSMNTNYQIFSDRLDKVMNDVAPLKQIRIKPRNQLHVPWMTVSLLKCSRKSKRLYRNSINCDKKSLKWQHYIEYRNCFQRVKNLAKKKYINDEISSFKGNSKLLWQLTNRILKGTNDKTSAISKLSVNGSEISDKNKMSDVLNIHFGSAGERVTKGITKNLEAHKRYLKNRVMEDLLFTDVTETEIIKIIENLPNKTSSGIDRISNILLKRLKYSLRLPVTLLVNQSLRLGIFPDQLKVARVIALHKGGSRLELDNYRPISLLPVVSKVFEKVVNKQFRQFLTHHNILSPRQFGFRPGHSTSHAVQNLVGEIVSGFDKNRNCMALFLDLRKCFDSCNYDIILSKLEHYGIRGLSLNWFESYLSNRYQFVDMPGMVPSPRIPLKLGLPQGSILGPILMCIQNNDFNNCLKLSNSILFADDTTVFVQGQNCRFLYLKMQNEIALISAWMQANLLAINEKKTKLMLFTPKNFADPSFIPPDIFMNNTKIDFVNEFQFLGTWLDKHLTWKSHVMKLVTKLGQLKFVFRKLKSILPTHCLRNLYYAFVHSRLTYCLISWGTMLKKEDLDVLIKTQKCFVRYVNNAKLNENSSPLFLRNKILKLPDLIELELIKQIFQYKNNLLPISVQRMYQPKLHSFGTRLSTTPNIEKHRSSIYNNSFLCKGVVYWEKSSVKYREISTLHNLVKTFKYDKFALY